MEGVDVDISLGSDDGVKAAEIIKTKIREYPEAKPLTILLKAFLKARRLTDVSQGGLGGYSLVNMVIAHLQEEQKVSNYSFDLSLSCSSHSANVVTETYHALTFPPLCSTMYCIPVPTVTSCGTAQFLSSTVTSKHVATLANARTKPIVCRERLRLQILDSC